MAIIAIAIKIDDGGPVFFRQDRVTMNGKVFSILKFRSMIVDAEKNGAVIPAIDNDPRITKVGKIIRKIRVDELPQIFNIIKGEMSIVGPRPERVEHVEKYKKEIPEFKYREKVKAGLTGVAQVYGKYNTSAYDKLKLDLMYIQNYRILLDIEIIFQTIKILFEKEEEVISPKRIASTSTEINILQIVEFDYKKYADLVNNYISTYAEEAKASVDLVFYLIEPTETRKLSSLNIPLHSQTYNISKELISYNNMEVNLNNNYWNDENTLYGLVGTICLLVLTFFIFRLTRLMVLANGNKSKYEVELKKILKEYDDYIVLTKEGLEIDENKTILKVSSFKELLDARNTLNKPIIYTKINNVKSEFVVEDESVIYKYIMKEADFE
jgi:lipopolysaccharide/colanic/teichoic acid biosynthesis glycosyltransferase